MFFIVNVGMKVSYKRVHPRAGQSFMGQVRQACGCPFCPLLFMLGFPQISCVSAFSYSLHVFLTFMLVFFLSPFPKNSKVLTLPFFVTPLILLKGRKKPIMCQDSPLSNTSGLTNIERALRALVTE